MAEMKCEILLNSELNNHQLSIAIDLACSLRADEIEKFLKTYDSIPESVGSEQIDQIKEMARQLAALPMKQFDMYRTKARLSGNHLNSPFTSAMTVKENIQAFGSANHITDVSKSEEKVEMKTTPSDTGENKITGVKSKKKSKKKKKNKAALLEEKPGISNVEISNKNSKDSSENQDILMTKNLSEPANQSRSRIATMNQTLVSDICCSDRQGMTSDKKTWTTKSQDISNLDIDSKEETKLKTMEENSLYEINHDSHNHHSFPPFGFPLSASKLIQSAIELLPSSSAATSNDSELSSKQNQDKNFVQQKSNTSGHIRQSTTVVSEIIECSETNSNESHKKLASVSGDQMTSKKCDPQWETGSVDGDTSNLSALEDDGGWQSQVRRSSRKKKKELDGRNPRERNQVDHKSKKGFQKDNNKTSNSKKQNFKNLSNRNQSGTFKEISKKYAPNDAAKDSNDKGLSSRSLYDEKGRKQGDVEGLFSYRDALLKTKPKPSEELQYNSDSGVDVNSVGSCDSAIHSSKTFLEFDVKEAVQFLIKGCDEVQVRQTQGGVHYYSQ